MGKISTFITGAAIGVAAALLLAPRSGEETRAFVAEKANAVAGEAKDFGAGLPGSAQDALKTAIDKGSAFVKDVPAKVQGVTGDATAKGQKFANEAAAHVKGAAGKVSAPDNDELREKIEAARKRIAAQVMENAEQSKTVDIAANDAPQAAEAVVDAAAETAEAAE